jgi:hypothetical protein
MASDSKRDVIHLDVGGTLYKVSRQTLQQHRASVLARLISDTGEGENADEPIFIDRNGRLFEYVLDYLRTEQVYLPFSVSRDAIKEEFVFYGIGVDMSNVHRTADTADFEMFIEKTDAIRIQRFVQQTATFVEREFSKYPTIRSVSIPQADYVQLSEHEDLLREQLLKRGLRLVDRDWRLGHALPYIVVEKVCSY